MLRYFMEELEELQKRLLEMSCLVESAIHDSVALLGERRAGEVRQILRNEARINRMEIEIDDFVLGLLALHQPPNGNSRLLTAVIKIGSDLERMGDLVIQIVGRALALAEQPPMKAPLDMVALAQLAESMVHQILEAFLKRDAQLALSVIGSDKVVGELRDAVIEELSGLMERDPATVTRALDLILITRNLERIAGDAAEIAEDLGRLIGNNLGQLRAGAGAASPQ